MWMKIWAESSVGMVIHSFQQQRCTAKGSVVCVDKIPVRYKYEVQLKLKASSKCEDDTDEIIVYGDSIEADPEGMAGKFNNDNITDKTEDSFQVDQENQGNTLLSVAPLPQQEPLDKLIINGESPESPPTNGHSATQTQVADTPM
ncbi:hypothetical protein cypCar_00018777 [Cyprinus carpio]|nr:hypothetical protein cypCar_00018777 [Cyprinus carpio]